jgi:hypothetical protein
MQLGYRCQMPTRSRSRYTSAPASQLAAGDQIRWRGSLVTVLTAQPDLFGATVAVRLELGPEDEADATLAGEAQVDRLTT